MVPGAEGLMALDAGVLMLRGAVDPVGEGAEAPGRAGTKVRRCRRSWVPENRRADDHVDVYPDDLGCPGAKVQNRKSPEEPAIVGPSGPRGLPSCSPGLGRGLARLLEVMPTPGFLVHCTS
jgi:hypothetical protein